MKIVWTVTQKSIAAPVPAVLLCRLSFYLFCIKSSVSVIVVATVAVHYDVSSIFKNFYHYTKYIHFRQVSLELLHKVYKMLTFRTSKIVIIKKKTAENKAKPAKKGGNQNERLFQGLSA